MKARAVIIRRMARVYRFGCGAEGRHTFQEARFCSFVVLERTVLAPAEKSKLKAVS
jgi:hypothetical protein